MVAERRVLGAHDGVRRRRPGRRRGFGSVGGQDQVLRNQSVGSTWIAASLRPTVVHRDATDDVVGAGLGVLDLDVEVAAVVEHAGVDQLVLHLAAGSAPGWCATRSSYGNAACGYLYSQRW